MAKKGSGTLTAAEIRAAKIAVSNGISKGSVARMLDVSSNVIFKALKPGFNPRKES